MLYSKVDQNSIPIHSFHCRYYSLSTPLWSDEHSSYWLGTVEVSDFLETLLSHLEIKLDP